MLKYRNDVTKSALVECDLCGFTIERDVVELPLPGWTSVHVEGIGYGDICPDCRQPSKKEEVP